jgi:Cu(I)/Ag(I) efflux system membrane fusion protein
MKATLASALVVLMAACGGDPQPADDPTSMTPEEHARMQAGGNQGRIDSTGAARREAVHLTADQEAALGIGYASARRESLIRTIRTVAQVIAPETNIVDVTPKVAGFVETMYVDATGASVRRGQPLLTLYSPALVAAQEELLTARRLTRSVDSSAAESWHHAQQLLAAARRRLAYWDISQDQITRLEETGEVLKELALASPVTGIVLERGVFEGQHVQPGQRLYRLADLTTLWIEGDVFEQDLQFARIGTEAHIEIAAFPGEHTMGRVSFVYPTMDEATRTARVRVTVDNRDLRLKPGMFATLFIDADLGTDALTIPEEALIATGERNLVFVRDTSGVLTPRDIVVGHRAAGRVVVLAGLAEGERIVASGNFLVDAESRLGGSGGMPGMQHGGAAPVTGDSGQSGGGDDHD